MSSNAVEKVFELYGQKNILKESTSEKVSLKDAKIKLKNDEEVIILNVGNINIKINNI